MFKILPGQLLRLLYPPILTLWVGGLWVVGYIAVPVLFSALTDRPLAGQIAGQMFTLMGWVGLGCATYLLLYTLITDGFCALQNRTWWIMAIMMLIGLSIQFGIQPQMVALKAQALPHDVMQSPLRPHFITLHGVSGALYTLESLLGALLVGRLIR